MTSHEPPRLAVEILERFLPDNEPLTGDLMEASRGRSRAWFWQQVLVAVLMRVTADLREHKRLTTETLLVATAMLALLGFHAVVAASLLSRVVLLQQPGAPMKAGQYAGWRPLVAAISFVVAVGIGRTIGRLHRRHRLGAVLVFGATVTAAAFLNLYLFVPGATLQSTFVPPDAGLQMAASMLFVGGLFVGMASLPLGSRVARTAALLMATTAVHPAVLAQSDDTATFDVASIRRNASDPARGSGLSAPQPGGRYLAIGVTLRRLAGDAYGGIDVVGGPPWADRDRFDVTARAAGEPSPDRIRRMLRPLLADRFQLRVHTEQRETAVYELRVDRADRRLGSALRPSGAACAEQARNYFPGAVGFPPPCGDYRLGATALVARGMTMPALARLLRGRVGRPVVDRTTVDGAFDLELEWTSDGGLAPALPDSAGAAELRGDGVTLFTALREQLGLRLVPARGAVEVLVIDNAAPPAAE